MHTGDEICLLRHVRFGTVLYELPPSSYRPSVVRDIRVGSHVRLKSSWIKVFLIWFTDLDYAMETWFIQACKHHSGSATRPDAIPQQDPPHTFTSLGSYPFFHVSALWGLHTSGRLFPVDVGLPVAPDFSPCFVWKESSNTQGNDDQESTHHGYALEKAKRQRGKFWKVFKEISLWHH